MLTTPAAWASPPTPLASASVTTSIELPHDFELRYRRTLGEPPERAAIIAAAYRTGVLSPGKVAELVKLPANRTPNVGSPSRACRPAGRPRGAGQASANAYAPTLLFSNRAPEHRDPPQPATLSISKCFSSGSRPLTTTLIPISSPHREIALDTSTRPRADGFSVAKRLAAT